MNYIVNLPSGTEITLGLPYGTATYKHGDIVPESYVTKSYPQYFSALPEPSTIIKQQINSDDDIIRKIKENILRESNKQVTHEDTLRELKSKKIPNELKNETPKQKAGRPAKLGFSKG